MSYTRAADLHDTSDICDLYAEVAAYYGLQPEFLNYDLVSIGIEDYEDDRFTRLLIDDDLETLLGVITAHLEVNFYRQIQCFVDGFFVRPDKIGGSRLIRELEKWAKLHNANKIIFNVKPEALPYFNRKGYSGIDIMVEKDLNG